MILHGCYHDIAQPVHVHLQQEMQEQHYVHALGSIICHMYCCCATFCLCRYGTCMCECSAASAGLHCGQIQWQE